MVVMDIGGGGRGGGCKILICVKLKINGHKNIHNILFYLISDMI